MSLQLSENKKSNLAQYVIKNNGSINTLHKKLDDFYSSLHLKI